MWKEITQEKTLSNNRTLRGLSDWLDGKGFRGAGRAVTHAIYHACIGSAKYVCFNRQGARAEFRRVREQLRRVGHTPEKTSLREPSESPLKDPPAVFAHND